MRVRIAPAMAGLVMPLLAAPALADKGMQSVHLGPRPFYLVENMDKSDLKAALQACAGTAPAAAAGAADAGGDGGGADRAFAPSDFSIGHRGAPLQFPEHTKESYEAAARMGAGIVECDVTFTKDRELVCRHAQCDLHTTTNILAVPELAAKCTEPFTPADPATGTRGLGEVLHERPHARRVQDARGQDGRRPIRMRPRSRTTWPRRPPWRTDLYAPRHADDPCREHRAVQGAGREVHARAQGARGGDAVRGRLHPGGRTPSS